MMSTREAIETMGRAIERQTRPASRQPRFRRKGGPAMLSGATMYWKGLAEIEPVPYAADSRKRDTWLQQVWRVEPRLSGIVNAVTLIDSNRGWSLIGGRNQVRRYTDILHASDVEGWRYFMRRASLSYWTTDLGAVVELGRDGRAGPLRGLYHVDSARCKLTGDPGAPIEYHARGTTAPILLEPLDFFRVVSMPSDNEAYNGLGYCAVSRAYELTRVLYAVLVHDQEQLAARAPRGLMLLQNISEDEWNHSLETRDAALDSMDRRYYSGVQILCSTGMDQIDAKLVALSQLPVGFDEQTFINLTMYGYSLCFGYDPREFWPVSQGSLGTGKETEVQHRKATGKGGMEFGLSFQEHLQLELPPTLAFEFEQRDDEGELLKATVTKAVIDNIARAYEAGLDMAAPLVTREEARQLLAEAGVIPVEWTEAQEKTTATDTEDTEAEESQEEEGKPEQGEDEEPADLEAERWLGRDIVQRAMAQFPGEDIVLYQWPSGELRTLWRPRGRPRFHAAIRREGDVLYEGSDFTITTDDVDQANREAGRRVGPDYEQLLTAPVLTPEELAKFEA